MMESSTLMATTSAAVEKWNFPLQELYRMAFNFYKQNSGKAVHLSYEDNLKLIAFKQQASLGPFNANRAPALGVLDVIGRDRQQHWQLLGDISREQAMEGFIDLLDTMCTAFRPYIEAVKQSRDETLKAELRRMEEEKQDREKREKEQQELLEEGYKEELQRRQLQDALNKQTYQQFKIYAERQFPGNPEQQAVLIHQLQREHYHQYMQQLHMQQQTEQQHSKNNLNTTITTTTVAAAATIIAATTMNPINNNNIGGGVATIGTTAEQADSLNAVNIEPSSGRAESCTVDHIAAATAALELNNAHNENHEQQQQQQQQETEQHDNEDDYVLIHPAKIWTRPDIEDFKTEVSAGDGDGVITIGHGDTVTVRVPTNVNGKCIFWEFATDNYDIGFGIYFEWAKPVTSEVTVHVSDSDDDDDYVDEDYLSATDDLESGSLSTERTTLAQNSTMKPPISIIVPIYRRECYNEVYVGSHAYPGEGVYLLKFDNSYSIWRSKTLYYRVYYER